MKIVVIGGTGLIGSRLVTKLGEHGHETVAASPNTGVNTLTGEGLSDALVGASVVIDVSNSPSFEDSAVMRFFETSTRNLLGAEAVAGVAHHVTLSVVGAERFRMDEFFREALGARHDPREVVTDLHARYFGAELSEGTLVPGSDAILAEPRYSDWPARTMVGR